MKGRKPTQISLIVPVYNGERYLRPLLESVTAQSVGIWECICVDDGSTDLSRQILNEFAASDERFRVFRQRNAGCGTARNTALRLVRTPFVMFADQDDFLHPRCFECALALIGNTDADAVCFEATAFREKYVPIVLPHNPCTIPILHRQMPPQEQFMHPGKGYSIFVWRHIFRREAVADVPFPPLSGGEDSVWMIELGWRGIRIVDAPVALYGNRHHPGSGSRGLSHRYIDNVFRAYDEIKARGIRYSVDSNYVIRFLNQSAFWFTLSAFYHGVRCGLYALRHFFRGTWRQ